MVLLTGYLLLFFPFFSSQISFWLGYGATQVSSRSSLWRKRTVHVYRRESPLPVLGSAYLCLVLLVLTLCVPTLLCPGWGIGGNIFFVLFCSWRLLSWRFFFLLQNNSQTRCHYKIVLLSLLPHPHCGVRLSFYRENNVALSSPVHSRGIVRTHAI